MYGVAGLVESILPGLFFKSLVALVDVQQISSRLRCFHPSAFAYVDIEKAVAVDVGHGYAVVPSCCTRHACRPCDVAESQVALIQIMLIGYLVAGKLDIRQD